MEHDSSILVSNYTFASNFLGLNILAFDNNGNSGDSSEVKSTICKRAMKGGPGIPKRHVAKICAQRSNAPLPK
jgi:hypothetical protein